MSFVSCWLRLRNGNIEHARALFPGRLLKLNGRGLDPPRLAQQHAPTCISSISFLPTASSLFLSHGLLVVFMHIFVHSLSNSVPLDAQAKKKLFDILFASLHREHLRNLFCIHTTVPAMLLPAWCVSEPSLHILPFAAL